jgi:hypothetical protein
VVFVVKRKRGRTAKDFINMWRRKYREATGKPYEVTWVLEGNIFKKLHSKLTSREIVDLIDFAFSGHESTRFLAGTGYSITAFRRCVNEFQVQMRAEVSEMELDLDIPFWDDTRTSWLWSKIRHRKIEDIMAVTDNKKEWMLLLEKMRRQDGLVPTYVLRVYAIWERGGKIRRKAVAHGDKGGCSGIH